MQPKVSGIYKKFIERGLEDLKEIAATLKDRYQKQKGDISKDKEELLKECYEDCDQIDKLKRLSLPYNKEAEAMFQKYKNKIAAFLKDESGYHKKLQEIQDMQKQFKELIK